MHYAALSGSSAAIACVLERYPALAESRDNNGRNLLHFAAWSRDAETFRQVVLADPKRAARLWVKDKNGNTPDSFHLRPSAKAILYDLFKQALIALDAGGSQPAFVKPLLDAFPTELVHYLLKTEHPLDPNLIVRLIDSHKLTAIDGLENFKALMHMKAIVTQEGILTKVLLRELMTAARAACDASHTKSSAFLETVATFAARVAVLEGDTLPYEAAITLSVMLDDYQRNMGDNPQEVDTLLMGKLLGTSTILSIRPRPELRQGLDIQSSNYLAHLGVFTDALRQTTLPPDARRIMDEIIAPGI